jgi:AcrR family transcriptional regulator
MPWKGYFKTIEIKNLNKRKNIMEQKYRHSTTFPGLKIKQDRGKKTYDALIKTCFQLLKKEKYASITVSDLAKSAGYSVGAFYARFRSKDEFFDAMVAYHFKNRGEALERIFSTFSNNNLIDELIKDIILYFSANQNFWRAALVRSMRDPDFWAPIRQSGHDVASRVIERISEQAGRSLTEQEKTNLRFAFQITFGTINNSIINQPGPIFMNQELFVEKLTRAFRLVSGIDNIKNKKQIKKKY